MKKNIIEALDFAAHVLVAMFSVVAAGGFLQGFLQSNGGLLDIGCLAVWGAVSSVVWLKLAKNPAVENSTLAFSFAAFYAVSIGSSACINLASIVWLFHDSIARSSPAIDMTKLRTIAPMSIIYFVVVWHYMHEVAFQAPSQQDT